MRDAPADTEFHVGTASEWSHTVTSEDVQAFAELSGDRNPIHLDDDYARARGFDGRIAHGALIGSYISRVLGVSLPGPGWVSMSYDFKFAHPVYIGDTIKCTVEVVHLSTEIGAAILSADVTDGRGKKVLRAKVQSMRPTLSEALSEA